MSVKEIKNFFSKSHEIEYQNHLCFNKKYKWINRLNIFSLALSIITPAVIILPMNLNSWLYTLIPLPYITFILTQVLLGVKKIQYKEKIDSDLSDWLTSEMSNPTMYKIYLIHMLEDNENFLGGEAQINKILTNIKEKKASPWLVKYLTKNLQSLKTSQQQFIETFLSKNKVFVEQSSEELTLILQTRINHHLGKKMNTSNTSLHVSSEKETQLDLLIREQVKEYLKEKENQMVSDIKSNLLESEKQSLLNGNTKNLALKL